MPSLFNTKQEANEYKKKHQLFVRIPRYVEGTGKWALVFDLEAHLSCPDAPYTVKPKKLTSGASHLSL